MSAYDFQSLLPHCGHAVEVVRYSKDEHIYNVAVECLDCNEVLLDYNNPGDLDQSEDGDIRAMLEIVQMALEKDGFLWEVKNALSLSDEDVARLQGKVKSSLEALHVPQG